MSGKKINPKFISDDMTTDLELLSEVQNRQNADVAMQQQLDNHSDQHLPGGSDALPTAVPVNTGTANTEGVSTSFARADHVHNTIINTTRASSTTEVSTNSTTNILLNAMSITPPQGNYIILASVILSSNDRSSANFLGIYVNGVLQSNTEEALENNQSNSATDVYMTYLAVTDVVTLNGSTSVEIGVRTTVGTTTYYIRNLLAIRVG